MAIAAPAKKADATRREKAAGRNVTSLYFRRLNGRYLLTNDWGHHARVSAKDFRRLLKGQLKPQENLWKDLQAKGFIRDHMDFSGLARDYRKVKSFLWQGPSLHILVATLRCNHKCLYCHSSAVDASRTSTDMSLETARAAVDNIFQSPSPTLAIEFQGGEPLLNWPVVRFAIRYARARNKAEKRKLRAPGLARPKQTLPRGQLSRPRQPLDREVEAQLRKRAVSQEADFQAFGPHDHHQAFADARKGDRRRVRQAGA
jgi:hypothetical protein